jgi:aryl-alcohol dehydrogenase-like predicted oxidoreductase
LDHGIKPKAGPSFDNVRIMRLAEAPHKRVYRLERCAKLTAALKSDQRITGRRAARGAGPAARHSIGKEIDVEQRRLGRSGLKVSLVGLGCNMLGTRVSGDAATRLVLEALDLGVTLFDAADIYRGPDGAAETILGEALAGRRNEAVIATKAGFDPGSLRRMGASRRYLTQALEASLRRLKTDHIDLYQIHTPDPDSPVDETLRALEDMTRAGKILHCGASNLAAWQAIDAGWTGRHLGLSGYVSVQNEYNLLQRGNDIELLPALDAAGMGLLPYFPLASGLLTGKYRRRSEAPEGSRLLSQGALADKFLTESNLAAVERLAAFAEDAGRSLTELAFAWLANKPQVSSIIAGATRIEQVRQNVAAIGWRMTSEEVATAERLAAGV